MWEKIGTVIAWLTSSGLVAWLYRKWYARNEKRRRSLQEIRKILKKIGKKNDSFEDHRQAQEEMEKWKFENESYFLFNNYPLQPLLDKKEGTNFLFNEVRRLLKRRPECETRYSEEQLRKLENKKAKLWKSLFAEAYPFKAGFQRVAEKLISYFKKYFKKNL